MQRVYCIMYKVSQSKYHQVISMNIFDTYMYSVEPNDCHLGCFGIFAHVNIPVPLYFFLKCLTISSVKKCYESN
jgi:hypothetical protein